MPEKKDSRTYRESNRVVGYLNDMYALRVRAYAYDKNISKSDAVVLMCRTFIQGLPDVEVRRMTQNYLQDLKISE